MTPPTNRVIESFASLRMSGERGLAPFVVAGRPGLDRLGGLLVSLENAGATMVEIGVPFSDPIADGPVIAAAMHKALQASVTPTGVFDAIRAARPNVSIPLIAMVSVSIVHRIGPDEFASRAADAGLDGLIVPDAPVEVVDPIRRAADNAGLTLSLLVGPQTQPDRARRIAAACSGFVYLLARAGITGEQAAAPDIAARVETLRGLTDLPIACGFGVSTADHVRAVVAYAEAAIVGSALVRRIEAALDTNADPIAEAASFVRSLASGLPNAD